MPKYDVPGGHANESYLKELCIQGLHKKTVGTISRGTEEVLTRT